MYYTYVLTNFSKSVLYTGVTSNLIRRLAEHYFQRGNEKSFTGKYHCYNLVYYEEYKYVSDAIAREKTIKKWPRAWKNNLINKENPNWIFLNNTLFDHWPPEDPPDKPGDDNQKTDKSG